MRIRLVAMRIDLRARVISEILTVICAMLLVKINEEDDEPSTRYDNALYPSKVIHVNFVIYSEAKKANRSDPWN